MASITPRSAKVPLYFGDYQQRVELLDLEIAAAQKAAERARASTAPRLIHQGPAGELEDARVGTLENEREALVAEAEANGEVVVVTLQALGKKDGVPGRRRWSDLTKANPPRDGDDVPEDVRAADAELGVNDETFGEALVPLSIAEISDPDLDVEDLLDNLSSAQFGLLYAVAFSLNRATGSDPKALRRSPRSPSSPETGQLLDASA